MKDHRANQNQGAVRAASGVTAPCKAVPAARSGDWLTVDELKDSVLAELTAGQELNVDVQGLNYLDGGTLQILLAAQVELSKQGRKMNFLNLSSELAAWIELAGASPFFLGNGEAIS